MDIDPGNLKVPPPDPIIQAAIDKELLRQEIKALRRVLAISLNRAGGEMYVTRQALAEAESLGLLELRREEHGVTLRLVRS